MWTFVISQKSFKVYVIHSVADVTSVSELVVIHLKFCFVNKDFFTSLFVCTVFFILSMQVLTHVLPLAFGSHCFVKIVCLDDYNHSLQFWRSVRIHALIYINIYKKLIYTYASLYTKGAIHQYIRKVCMCDFTNSSVYMNDMGMQGKSSLYGRGMNWGSLRSTGIFTRGGGVYTLIDSLIYATDLYIRSIGFV